MISDVIVMPFGREKEDVCIYNISSRFHCRSLDTSEVTREEECILVRHFSYFCLRLSLRESPCEDHQAGESTVHFANFPDIWHNYVLSLVHSPYATVLLNYLLLCRNVNQNVRR